MVTSQHSATHCPQCQQGLKDPRILPCSHTLCGVCIQNALANKSGALDCPLCNEKVVVPQIGVQGYMQNLFCVSLTQALYEDKSQTVSGDVSRLDKSSLEAIPAMCDRHGFPIKTFCGQCHTVKCDKCNESCQQHKKYEIHNVAKKGRTDLEKFVKQCKDKLRAGEKAVTSSKESLKKDQSIYESVIKEVEERRDYFLGIISGISSTLIQDVKDMEDSRLQAISRLQTRVNNMRGLVEYTGRLLDIGRKVDVAQQHEIIGRKLVSCAKEELGPVVSGAVKVVYDDEVEVPEELKGMFGGVYAEAGSKAASAGIPPQPSGHSLASGAPPPSLVAEIDVPLHVNGICGIQSLDHPEHTDIYIASKGIRLNALSSLFVRSPSKTGTIDLSSPRPPTPPTPEFHVMDYDTGKEVRTLTVKRNDTNTGNEILDTGGDELRSFATKQRFLDATVMSNGFIAASNDNKKRLSVFTPNGIVARETHIPKSKGPWGVACSLGGASDGGDALVVADCDARRVTVHDSSGKLTRTIDKSSEGKEYFGYPCFVAARGKVTIVSDVAKHRVSAFNIETGELLWKYGQKGPEKGDLYRPEGVCVDTEGHVYVAENGNNRISVLSMDGQFIRYLLTEKDGLATPFAISLTPNNQLFVLERVITKPAKPMKIKQYNLV